ncbi:MAG: hypothetical protein QM532_00965 [Cyanobium sp. MAG06]|nr:hypothetical protein [Cyanobium sp. MAG06]
MGIEVYSPCSNNTFLASCTETPILVFSTITIPFMSIVFFLATIYLAIQSYKKSTNTKINNK